jgi:hypothetical protein
MSQGKLRVVSDLNPKQLDVGLRILNDGLVDVNEFWDENITAFRQTLLVAIRETSDALASDRTPLSLRIELEKQLESLIQYVELADCYIARRSLSFERSGRKLPLPELRIH